MKGTEDGILWVKYTPRSRPNAHVLVVPIRWTTTDFNGPQPAAPTPHACKGRSGTTTTHPASVGSDDDANNNDDESDDDGLCVVCMEQPAGATLLPCRHARFCRRCVFDSILAGARPEPPRCPLCRSSFHTMVFPPADCPRPGAAPGLGGPVSASAAVRAPECN